MINPFKFFKEFLSLRKAFIALVDSKTAVLEDGKAYIIQMENATPEDIERISKRFRESMKDKNINAHIVFFNGSRIIEIGGK